MASPPVARIKPMSRWVSRAFVASMVVMVMLPTAPSGAPALLAASWMIFTVSTMQFLAPGWGLMTMALPAFRAMMLLYMAVEVGLVEGMRAATTPMGTPTSIRPLWGSSRRMPTAVISRMLSQVMALPRRFFSTLSCQTP